MRVPAAVNSVLRAERHTFQNIDVDESLGYVPSYSNVPFDVMTIYTGKVGIGTTQPREKLHVDGNIWVEQGLVTSNLHILKGFTIGSGANVVESHLQVRPVIHKMIVSSNVQSSLTVNVDGFFTAAGSNADLFVNGVKQIYLSCNVADYDLTYSFNWITSNTEFQIAMTSPLEYGDMVDITIWPQLYQPTSEYSGVMQSFTYLHSDSVWSDINGSVYQLCNVGIGTTVASHPLEVKGTSHFTDTIYISSNIMPTACNVYDLGAPDFRFRDLYLSGSTIDLGGVRIQRDPEIPSGAIKIANDLGEPVDTKVNKVIAETNLCVGTSNPQYPLHVVGDGLIEGTLHMIDIHVHADRYVTLPKLACGIIQYSVPGSVIQSTTSTDFQSMYSYVYDGTGSGYKPYKADFYSRLVPVTPTEYGQSNFFYEVRAVDVSNNVILGSNLYSNSNYQLYSLPLYSLPSTPSIFELQIRKGSLGSSVAIQAMQWGVCNI